MKIKVLERFVNKFDRTERFEPGQVLDFDDERAADVIERGLAEAVEEPAGDEDPAGDENDKSPEGGLDESPENGEVPEKVEADGKESETPEQVGVKPKAKKSGK